MRVVVSLKPTPGGGATSQATRYIAYRERDEEREGRDPRPLFSAREDSLSYRRAETVLRADRVPEKNELLHLAISFRPPDYQGLGGEEAARQKALREVTREAVAALKEELSVNELRWVAGIHRNTDHPHIHLLLHRDVRDRETGREYRIHRLPESAIPSRNEERIEPGSFAKAFAEALDRAQERERATDRDRERAARDLSLLRLEETRERPKEKVANSDDVLLAAARRNPSLAGRELIQEILLTRSRRKAGCGRSSRGPSRPEPR